MTDGTGSASAGRPDTGSHAAGVGSARGWAAPAVLAAGAIALAAALGAAGVRVDALPAIVGAVALVAGLAGRRASTAVVGATLLGFGLAILAVRVGPLPANREAPAAVVGLGAGVGVGALLAGLLGRPADVAVASLAMLAVGAAFWAAYDVAWILGWPLWTAALLIWAASEAWHARS
jgi:hypothetical protein